MNTNTSTLIDALRDAKMQINMHLRSTDFADKELARLSINVQVALDAYDAAMMSERDKAAWECRHSINEMGKTVDKLYGRMCGHS